MRATNDLLPCSMARDGKNQVMRATTSSGVA
jgi:hypothetical protein